MEMETKVRRIGNSLGIVLPKEALHTLAVKEGSTLYLTPAAEGSLRLTPEQPEFSEWIKLANQGIHDYRNALRELAK